MRDRLLGIGDQAHMAGHRAGHPPRRRASCEVILSPMASMAFRGRPMKMMPSASSAAAKAVFSLRKP